MVNPADGKLISGVRSALICVNVFDVCYFPVSFPLVPRQFQVPNMTKSNKQLRFFKIRTKIVQNQKNHAKMKGHEAHEGHEGAFAGFTIPQGVGGFCLIGLDRSALTA